MASSTSRRMVYSFNSFSIGGKGVSGDGSASFDPARASRCCDLTGVFKSIKEIRHGGVLNRSLKALTASNLSDLKYDETGFKESDLSILLTCEKCRLVALCALLNQASKLKRVTLKFPDTFEEAVFKNIHLLNPKSLALMMGGLVTLNYSSTSFHQKFAKHLHKENLTAYSPRDLSTILWALTNLGVKDPVLFEKFEAAILARPLEFFNFLDLSQITSSFAKLEIRSMRLFQKISEEIQRREIFECSWRDLSDILGAFAHLGIRAKHLFRYVSNELVRRDFSKAEPRYLGHVMWSFAFINVYDENLLDKLRRYLDEYTVKRFDAHSLSNLLWSILVFYKPVYKRSAHCLVTELENKEKVQKNPLYAFGVDKDLRLKAKLILREKVTDDEIKSFKEVARETTSDFQKNILRYLQKWFEGVHEGVFSEKTFHTPDIVFKRGGEVVAFAEAEGPYHTVVDFQGNENHSGSTQLRNYLIREFEGIPLVLLQSSRWDKLQTDKDKKKYLQKKLKGVAVLKEPVAQ